MAEVIVIPQATLEDERTVRVAAYCRVSSLPQEESYESQVEHFTTTISTHPDWILVKVYGDEGITGLNTIKRKGFKQMLRDARARKFDVLLVKSISRLGRNTVDLLSSVRELRSVGVVCYFEKENINTDESAGELMITLLSAFAQMESESISQNVRIGLGYKMQRGEWSVAYSNFLGYDRTNEGEVVINLEGARTVRYIFDSFLSGRSLGRIAKDLVCLNYVTGKGTLAWNKQSVKRILCNRKYCGDVVLQLTVTDDFITKHRCMNTGQAPQYIVVDGIPAIVSKQSFFLAQGELERRGRLKFDSGVSSYKNGFTGKLHCSCGANYNRVNARCHYVWKCYKRIHGECRSDILSEAEVEDATVRACQVLWDRHPSSSTAIVPVLTEDSTMSELESAAEVNMENVYVNRIADFIKGGRPPEYNNALLDLIESITYDRDFTFRFYTGIEVRVSRISVSHNPIPHTETTSRQMSVVNHFHVSGEPRKRLANRLAALTGNSVSYLGFPSCAFEVGKYRITQDGSIEGKLSKRVLKGLKRSGFEPSQE